MDAPKALLGALVGRFIFREGTVEEVRRPTPRFAHVMARGPGLAGATFVPGDKVQLFLPGIGMRTYTPIEWNGDRASFLGFAHGEGPGANWVRTVKPGDVMQVMGPRRSLNTSSLRGDLVVVGDETSLALTAAVTRASRDRKVTAVLEARDVDEVKTLAASLGLTAEVRPAGETKPLLELLCARIDAGATPLFSGRASTIQALKQGLRAANRSVGGLSKAYWADGKRGLD